MILLKKSTLAGIWLCCLIGGELLAQDQHTMNRQAEANFEKADAELNKTYRRFLADLKDPEAQAKLKAAQRAWIAFRDAQAEFEADQDARGGSMYPMLFYANCADLTRERIKQLRGSTKDSR